MYQKYTTEGFLVSSRTSGEADRLYLFYTAEFGMILASARSVRSIRSKLRPHIKDGVMLTLTLLKSKNRWKLLEASNESRSIDPKEDGYKGFLRLLSALKTLVAGEERNDSLYASLRAAFVYLTHPRNASEVASAECLLMIQMLHALGYGEPKNAHQYETATWSDDIIEKVSKDRKELVLGINKALKATGL